jgi:cyclopropane fatty-acyl-phospholipid synthase-like methyltransferase
MNESEDTSKQTYTNRLYKLEYKRWKQLLNVQYPYQRDLLKSKPGRTLDIGCGIGRYLKILPKGSIGIDHNKYSVEQVKRMGLEAHTVNEFDINIGLYKESFDSILLAHILEHLTFEEGEKLIKKYLPLLKKNGKVIVHCPQEQGFTTDQTHVTFLDSTKLENIMELAGLSNIKYNSFPLPRVFGKIFKYNEFRIIGVKK